MYGLFLFAQLVSVSQSQITDPDELTAFASSVPSYTYGEGGRDWKGLCATGHSQSPIDIHLPDTLPVSDPYFSSISFDIPIQIAPFVPFQAYHLFNLNNSTLWAVFNETPFQLIPLEVHIHFPAAHLIDGRRHAGEMHISCFNPAVNETGIQEVTLVLLFREGNRSVLIDGLLNGDPVDFSTLIDSPIDRYFYYFGAREVPTPDCYEANLYAVVDQVFELTADQAETYLSQDPLAQQVNAGHGEYREVQPLNGRTVYHRVPDVDSQSFLV